MAFVPSASAVVTPSLPWNPWPKELHNGRREMDRIKAWRKYIGDRGGWENSQNLLRGVGAWKTASEGEKWHGKIVVLGSAGYGVRGIEQILTGGWSEHDKLRKKWDLGDGKDAKWGPAEKAKAKEVLWDFVKVMIQSLRRVRHGKKRPGVQKVSKTIRSETGFRLP